MTEFYEPMLYMSTPDHPNTMGVLVELKEEVDGDILRCVVDDLGVRFPYFYIRVEAEGNGLITVDNPLPMTVRNSWKGIDFNAPESNYHLGAWKYLGKRVAFEISHCLTDGAGVLPYVKSAMYLYLSRRTGLSFDPSSFRLPGQEIPESEIGNPFKGLDIDNAEPPLYLKEHTEDFYRLNKDGRKEPIVTYLRLQEGQLMAYCRDYDGSPNAFISVLMVRAARQFDPGNTIPITVTVAIDHKANLGNFDNYRLFGNVIELDFPYNRNLDDLGKSCTITRGQIFLQAQKENSLFAMRQRKLTYAKLDQLPLEMKLNVVAKSAGMPRWSLCLSYANSRSFGPLDPHIESVYVLAEPGVADAICEISCINHHFFLSVMQTFSSNRLIECLLKEFSSIGIDCEVMGQEELDLCGIASYTAK